MNRFLALTKVLFKNGQNPDTSGKEKVTDKAATIVIRLIALAVVVGVFILCLSVGKNTFPLEEEARIQALLSLFILYIGLVLITGIPLILSSFFLSKDVQLYIHMPFRGRDIVGAKLLMSMGGSFVLAIVMLLPELIGFGQAANFGVTYYLYSIIVILLIAVIPTVIISGLAIGLMHVLRNMKGKDALVTVVTYGTTGLILLASMMPSGGSGNFVEALSENPWIRNIITFFCPVSGIAARALIDQNLLDLLLFIVITVAALWVFMVLADKLYIKSASASGSTGKKKAPETAHLDFEKKKLKASLLQKENRMFFRSAVCVMNSVTGMLLVPVSMLIALFVSSLSGGQGITQLLSGNNNPFIPIFTIAISIVCCFLFSMIASMNRITPTSVSREGEGFYLLKAMPIQYKALYNAKKRTGFWISLSICGIMATVIWALLLGTDLPPLLTLLIIPEAVAVVMLTNNIQMFYGCKHPIFIWDSEENIIRKSGFLFTILCVGVVLIAGTALVIGVYYLERNPAVAAGLWCTWVVAVALLAEFVLTRKGVNILKSIGE